MLWSFISGVLVSSLAQITPVFCVFLILLAGVIFVIEKVRAPRGASAAWGMISHEATLIVVALLCFGMGALRYDIKDFHEPLTPSGEGIVASEPEHRDADTRFVYQADNGKRALVSTDMYSHVEYGDQVSVSCKFKKPEIIAEDNGVVFNYPQFLSKDDIYYTCSFAKVEILADSVSVDSRSASGQSLELASRLVSILLKIKSSFVQKMKAFLPEPESSLLAGLIVAGKDVLPKSVLQDFQNAGVVHIVVLSGYNITVVAEFFLVILGLLSISLRKRTVFAMLGILLFVLMAGASASIVRAAIMALVVLLGKVIHRSYSAPRALLLAAALMILWNPKILVFDPSFHLSFLAMLALIYVEPLIKPHLGFITEKHELRALVATTIATQLTVLPYLLYTQGSVSIVSLVSNILILGFVPITMLIGFLATLLAFVSRFLAWPLGFIAHILLAWILGVARTLGNLSWASVHTSISLSVTIFLYIVFLIGIGYLRKRFEDKTKAQSV